MGHPAHGEVEFWHADERAQRRRLTSARAARERDVGQQAEPRGLWHEFGLALSHTINTGATPSIESTHNMSR